MGAISSATFVKIASGCWRKEREHRRARFPYCQNSAISLRRRAKRKNCWRKSGAANGVRETKGMRKSGSLEKKCSASRRARSLGFQGCGPSRKERGKLVPSKKSAVHPGEPDLLAPWAPVSPRRNEEKWFPRKKVQCIPASLISWLPGHRSRREGMRKSGSVEKEYGDSPAALTSWLPGRGSEPRGMSKSGSSK